MRRRSRTMQGRRRPHPLEQHRSARRATLVWARRPDDRRVGGRQSTAAVRARSNALGLGAMVRRPRRRGRVSPAPSRLHGPVHGFRDVPRLRRGYPGARHREIGPMKAGPIRPARIPRRGGCIELHHVPLGVPHHGRSCPRAFPQRIRGPAPGIPSLPDGLPDLACPPRRCDPTNGVDGFGTTGRTCRFGRRCDRPHASAPSRRIGLRVHPIERRPPDSGMAKLDRTRAMARRLLPSAMRPTGCRPSGSNTCREAR